MFTTSHKLVTAVFLAVVVVGSSADAFLPQATPADAPPRAQPVDAFGDPLPDGALARMGTLRWRHGGAVFFVGFSAEGKQLVTASVDGSLRVWEAASGKPLHILDKPKVDVAQLLASRIQARVRNVQVGFASESPTSVVLAPDRKIVAAALSDGTVGLWDVTTGKAIGRLGEKEEVGRGHGVNGIAFAPDSKVLATRGSDHIIRLWDTATGKEVRQLNKANERQTQVPFYGSIGNTLAFSADGKMLAAMNTTLQEDVHGIVTLWDVATGNELRRIDGGPSSLSGRLAFGPDVLVISWGNRLTQLYDPATGKDIRPIGEQNADVIVHSHVFAPDGKTLATRTAGSNPAIQLWDVTTGKELRRFGEQPTNRGENVFISNTGLGSSCQTLAYSPDGKLLAEALPSSTVRLWEADTGKEIAVVGGHHGAVAQVALSADGKTVTTRSADRTIRHWDARTGKELRQHKLASGTAVLSADGTTLAFGDEKNSLRLWDAAAFKERRAVEVAAQQPLFDPDGRNEGLLALAPNGKVAAVRDEDRTIHVYDAVTGKHLRRLSIQNRGPLAGGVVLGGGNLAADATPSLCFSPDGATLASLEAVMPEAIDRRRGAGNGVFLCLWEVATGKLLRVLEWKNGTLSTFALAPDGQTLIAANTNGTLSAWETLTGKECFKFKTEAAGGAAPAPPNDEEVLVRTPPLQALAVSPDGRTLAVGGTGRTIHLFDLGTGVELGQLTGHTGTVVSLSFAGDNRTLLSGSNDTTALAWDARRFRRAEALAATPLTAEQREGLWNDLAGDAAKAHQAIRALSAFPKEAATLLGERVQPAKGTDVQEIVKLIADLENNKFEVRQKATDELEKLGELAEPALHKVLDSQPGLETRQRIERILEKRLQPQPLSPEALRELRAVRALGQLQTPAARQVLRRLTEGAAGARLTREAEAALNRSASAAP